MPAPNLTPASLTVVPSANAVTLHILQRTLHGNGVHGKTLHSYSHITSTRPVSYCPMSVSFSIIMLKQTLEERFLGLIEPKLAAALSQKNGERVQQLSAMLLGIQCYGTVEKLYITARMAPLQVSPHTFPPPPPTPPPANPFPAPVLAVRTYPQEPESTSVS